MIRSDQPGSRPLDDPDSVPNPATRPVRTPKPEEVPPVRVPEKEPAKTNTNPGGIAGVFHARIAP